MIYVIGSGPAGISCTWALLQKGAQVTLLDVGLELEPERSNRLDKIRKLEPEQWQRADLEFLKEGMSAGTDGIPLKYAYGSAFPYLDPGVGWGLEKDGVETRPSFAKGGLSTVWGAAMLPYRQDDLHNWPIGERELANHYRAVLEFVPLSSCHDSLEQLFPLYTGRPQALNVSSQAKHFLHDLSRSHARLNAAGIRYGASRLAVWAQSDYNSAGCRYCGQCMYGCPYAMIYSSAYTLDLLRRNPNFTYRSNVAVDRVLERGEKVTLLARDPYTRQRLQLQGSRVFLACGTLATTKILLESLDAFDVPLTVQDCFYFLLPLLRFGASSDISRERLHTLAQVFLEILDPQICDQTVHLQVYTYNELYSVALKRLFGPIYSLLSIPCRMLLERLLLIQGYLPSEYSPSFRAVLCKDSKSNSTRLRLSAVANQRTHSALGAVVRKLREHSKFLRAFPVTRMLRPGKPGRSFHCGGTFPMRARPVQFESDQFGRPYGFSRVHAVDSTIFPSIPATTITLSVMANAHRIGSGLGDY